MAEKTIEELKQDLRSLKARAGAFFLTHGSEKVRTVRADLTLDLLNEILRILESMENQRNNNPQGGERLMELNMAEVIEDKNNGLFTQRGIESLRQRLSTWIDLFNNKKYPISAQMLGFGSFSIESKSELVHRIRELAEIIGAEIRVEKKTMKNTEGKRTTQEVMSYV